MKTVYRLILLSFAAILATGFTACSDDSIGDSIFDTREKALDRNAYTFPLDSFVKVNFLEPYNLRFIYKMEDIGSDMDKNLVPGRYEQSKKLAVLSKNLWYDVYKKYAGELFLKENSPRIIHAIGSKSYNPSQGTETLGFAEGGLKITLYGVNELDESNLDYMNKYFFQTMHHEFGHILDQTVLHPLAFNTISTGRYDAMGWTDTPDSVSIGRGFASSYGSSGVGEDLVEISSTYIVADTLRWEAILNTAEYEWEMIDTEFGSEAEMLKAKFGNARYQPTPAERDTCGYFKKSDSGKNKIYRKACQRDADDAVVHDEVVKKYDEHVDVLKETLSNITITEEELNGDKHVCEYENCPHFNVDYDQMTDDEKKAYREKKLLEKIKNLLATGSEAKEAALIAVKGIVPEFKVSEDELKQIKENSKPLIEGATLKNYAENSKKLANLYLAVIDSNKFTVGSFITAHIAWIHDSHETGKEVILRKLDLVRQWLNEGFGFSIDDIRREVQQRTYVTDENGDFVIVEDPVTGKRSLVNRLTQLESDGRTVMEHMLDEVEQYKALQK